MPTKPRKEAPEEAIPDPSKPAEEKRGPGRPPGSKTKKKTTVKAPVPEMLLEPIATAPLTLVSAGVRAGLGVQMVFDRKAVDQMVQAFRAWAETWEIEISPLGAYLSAMATCLGAGFIAAVPVEQPGQRPPPPPPSPQAAPPSPPKPPEGPSPAAWDKAAEKANRVSPANPDAPGSRATAA